MTRIVERNSASDSIWARFLRAGLVPLLFVSMLAIAGSWLVFPYVVKEQNLLESVGGDVKQERLRNAITIGQLLTRTTFGSGEAQVDMLYAPPRFFAVTDRADMVSDYRPDLYHVFLVTETTHIDDLPESLPKARLFVDDREQIVAAESCQHPPLIGRDRRGIAVVNVQCLDRRAGEFAVQRVGELDHVDGPRSRRTQVGPLQPVKVKLMRPTRREQNAARRMPPASRNGGQTRDRPNRHSAAGVPLQPVVDADRRWLGLRVLGGELFDFA